MKIISISGKAESGKDLTGKIIQYLVAVNRHNHNMSFDDYQSIFLDSNKWCEWKIKKFAKKLKEICAILLNTSEDSFEDRDFKESFLGSEWGTKTHTVLNNIPVFANINFNKLISVREFMQKIGTELFRDNFHENTWVNALFNDVKEYASIIITDTRFINELEEIKKRKGMTIKIIRPCKICNLLNTHKLSCSNNVIEHNSERNLDNEKFDYVIKNDKDINSLIKKVEKILIKEKII